MMPLAGKVASANFGDAGDPVENADFNEEFVVAFTCVGANDGQHALDDFWIFVAVFL